MTSQVLSAKKYKIPVLAVPPVIAFYIAIYMTSQVLGSKHYITGGCHYIGFLCQERILSSESFQNHGYAVGGSELPEEWEELFVNENDHSNEGLVHAR